jgi:hypothetical protein
LKGEDEVDELAEANATLKASETSQDKAKDVQRNVYILSAATSLQLGGRLELS